MEREAGGGLGKGNTCKSMADSCQYMAKTKKKVIVNCLSHQHFLIRKLTLYSSSSKAKVGKQPRPVINFAVFYLI